MVLGEALLDALDVSCGWHGQALLLGPSSNDLGVVGDDAVNLAVVDEVLNQVEAVGGPGGDSHVKRVGHGDHVGRRERDEALDLGVGDGSGRTGRREVVGTGRVGGLGNSLEDS